MTVGGHPRIASCPEKPVEPDMSWVDRLEPLDEYAAAAALERPGPDSYERPEIDLD